MEKKDQNPSAQGESSKPRGNQSFTPADKRKIDAKTNPPGSCQDCGRETVPSAKQEWRANARQPAPTTSKTPKSQGGTRDVENGVPLCKTCHEKGIVDYVRSRQIGKTDVETTRDSQVMTGTWQTIYDWSVEIWFHIEKDDDGYPRSKNWEQLLAWPVIENDRFFRIESIPFFVKGISRGDIVKAKVSENTDVQEAEFFEFESIVERGGHNTYRLLLRENRPNDPELTKEELLAKGLALEIEDADFFAVDVPPSVNQKEIDDFLIGEAKSGRWGLEDGFVGHMPP